MVVGKRVVFSGEQFKNMAAEIRRLWLLERGQGFGSVFIAVTWEQVYFLSTDVCLSRTKTQGRCAVVTL